MNIAGNSSIVLNGKVTRILSRDFNRAVKKNPEKLSVQDADGNLIVPSKGLTWLDVGAAIREGKKVQAKTEKQKVA